VQSAGRLGLAGVPRYVDATFQLRLIAETPDLLSWTELAISNPFTSVAGKFQEAALIYTASSLDPKYTRLGIHILVSGAGNSPGHYDNILFDNVRLDASPAAAVPEPATMFLLGSGLIGIGAFVRRRFKK
jgi:hypothetical protein